MANGYFPAFFPREYFDYPYFLDPGSNVDPTLAGPYAQKVKADPLNAQWGRVLLDDTNDIQKRYAIATEVYDTDSDIEKKWAERML